MPLPFARTTADATRAFRRRWSKKAAAVAPSPRLDLVLLIVGTGALLLLADEPLARALARLPRPAVALAHIVTDFGLAAYMLVLAGAVAIAGVLARGRGAGRRLDAGMAAMSERATLVFASVAAAGLAAQILKHVVGRARPRFIDTLGPFHFDILDLHASRNSFPSGHAANAFAAAAALGLFCPRARPWLFCAATLVGISRVFVHAHYGSDVAFGALVGVGVSHALAAAFAARRIALYRCGRTLVPRGRHSAAALFRTLQERTRLRQNAG